MVSPTDDNTATAFGSNLVPYARRDGGPVTLAGNFVFVPSADRTVRGLIIDQVLLATTNDAESGLSINKVLVALPRLLNGEGKCLTLQQ